MAENQASEKNGNKVLTYIIILLAVAVIGLGYREFSNQQALNEKEKANNELTSEYNTLEKQYNTSIEDLKNQKGRNAELDSILDVKIAEIETLMAEAKKNKSTIYSVRKKRNALQKLVDNNKLLIDSLVQVNNWLTGQNDSLSTELTSSQTANSELTKKNSELQTKGAQLVALNVIGMGQRKKPNGKVSNTAKAKKVNRIQVCFDIAENKIAKSESKEIYLRLLSPGGDVLTIENQGSSKERILNNEPAMEYSMSKSVMYTNTSMNQCLYWEQNKPFNPGKYVAEVYSGGAKIGTGEFRLQ